MDDRVITPIRFRRGLQYEWSAKNPLLGAGEPGVETDTHRFKIGDGLSAWNALPYFMSGPLAADDSGLDAVIQAHIDAAEPHPAYDDGPSLSLLYDNAKV